jgi:hypothetical protein
MLIEEVQADLGDLLRDVVAIREDMENAECCEVKSDLCENLRSALLKVSDLKVELQKFVRKAEKCSG